jgi:catechol 2,3-dioxygenase-like lactoylglutathione lyase family enzyme
MRSGAVLDHVSVGARDMYGARRFYAAVLAVLGLRIVDEAEGRFVDFGAGGPLSPEFSVETPVNGEPASPGNGVHVAFLAPSAAAVEAFHSAALANGGRSDGQPGPRPAYGPGYYSAFVFDPEGNKVEAVWRATVGVDAELHRSDVSAGPGRSGRRSDGSPSRRRAT